MTLSEPNKCFRKLGLTMAFVLQEVTIKVKNDKKEKARNLNLFFCLSVCLCFGLSVYLPLSFSIVLSRFQCLSPSYLFGCPFSVDQCPMCLSVYLSISLPACLLLRVSFNTYDSYVCLCYPIYTIIIS